MKNRRLSIFVDESGKFQVPDALSPFYIVGLVFHDQDESIDELVRKLDADWDRMGYENFCFHAGPLIRKEKGYSFMKREERQAIWRRMMLFSRQAKFSYHCLVVDKRFVDTEQQIVEKLKGLLGDFLDSQHETMRMFDSVKLYYDCGQSPITKMLHDTLTGKIGTGFEIAQAVRPENYKLFQLADLICTVKLLETKLQSDLPLTVRESKLFGGPRDFKRNILKPLKAKEI